ncbi:MAG: hypothetical protein Q9M41_06670 [Paracoccaceae bacterium]|nr:hypothetical protein [Paracoccaceae bacterium]
MKLMIILTAATVAFAGAAHAAEIKTSPQPAGNTVTVDSVTIDGDGWLVIHAIKNGKPVVPASIGHVAIKSGTTENVVVKLTRATKPGEKLLPMLHVDQGYMGEYEFPGADHPVMKDGKPVVKPLPIK